MRYTFALPIGLALILIAEILLAQTICIGPTCTAVIGAADVDVGPHALKAASLEIGTIGQPTRIDLTQGSCPLTAAPGYHFTLCMEGGVLYKISSLSVKSPVGLQVAVPGSAATPCVPGQYAADASFHYDCIAIDTWVRSAAAGW